MRIRGSAVRIDEEAILAAAAGVTKNVRSDEMIRRDPESVRWNISLQCNHPNYSIVCNVNQEAAISEPCV